MKKIIMLLLLCNVGCAGLNHNMLANSLNNADEQLKKECECECEKTKKKSQNTDMTKYEIFDEDW